MNYLILIDMYLQGNMTKVSVVKGMVFPVVMYRCESWTIKKNWCFRTVVMEETLESPLNSKEIKPVNPKGNLPWIFNGRTDAEVETSIFCLPDAKSQLIGKYPDIGKGWGQEEKGLTEDEMVGWHHLLNEHEFELWKMVKDREACPWGCRVGHDLVTEQQQW